MPLLFEWINFIVFGLVGFLLTLITLLKTLGTKRAVSKAFERVDFRKDMPEFIPKLERFENTISERSLNAEESLQLRFLLSRLQNKYSATFGAELNNAINAITLEISPFLDSVENNMTNSERSELLNDLNKIIELLKKEVKF